MKFVSNKLLFYQLAARASMPFVRMHKIMGMIISYSSRLRHAACFSWWVQLLRMRLTLMDLLVHVLINTYYYFYTTANSESKDFFSVRS